ncbi:MAG: serine--tRNA ligase [Bacteroidota bacterium]
MLSLSLIRSNPEAVVAALAKRNLDVKPAIEALLRLNEERRRIQTESETLQAEANRLAKEIGGLMRDGRGAEAEAVKARTTEIKVSIQALAGEFEQLEGQERDQLLRLPNMPHESVAAGKSAEDNEVVAEWSPEWSLAENAVPHWELTERYKLIDFERGVKVTGAGFPFYTGKGARLQRALIQFFLDRNTEAGYLEVQPPHFVNAASGYGTGQLPDKDGQMYHMGEDQLYAIPTAEVPVTNMLRDEILPEADLPVKLTAYSPCFRREAGSYGKDVRGLNRLHQFDKVEIVCVEHPSRSYDRLEEMVAHVAGLLQALELPYRVLRLCGGDMGFTSALTYDFEVWSAAQERWLEVSSVSNFETFQANRLMLRYRSEGDGKPYMAHTLNGSSLALPRVVAALLENNQTAEGIRIPKALAAYTGFEWIQ